MVHRRSTARPASHIDPKIYSSTHRCSSTIRASSDSIRACKIWFGYLFLSFMVVSPKVQTERPERTVTKLQGAGRMASVVIYRGYQDNRPRLFQLVARICDVRTIRRLKLFIWFFKQYKYDFIYIYIYVPIKIINNFFLNYF